MWVHFNDVHIDMKKILSLLLVGFLFVACGNNDDDADKGYLTSLENVKQGIVGTWESRYYYYNYASDGTRCSGFEPDGNWSTCTTYEVLKSGSDYILRLYTIGGSSYNELIIKVLTDDRFELVTQDGRETMGHFRVTPPKVAGGF